jgi:hypothetical protein
VRKTGALLASVIVFVVGQSQERRICGHSNVRITRLSLAMIVAPAARNLKFPVKFPVSREFDVGSADDCVAAKTNTLAAMDGVARRAWSVKICDLGLQCGPRPGAA